MSTINSTNNYATAKFIVSSTPGQGNYTTIAAALTAASSGDTIFLKTGTYTENITMKDSVNLTAFECDGTASVQGSSVTANVTILGTITASYSGNATISGILCKTNGATAISMTGSNVCRLNMVNCTIYANDAIGITLNNSTSVLNCLTCILRIGSSQQMIAATATGGVDIENCIVNNAGSPVQSTIAAGRIVLNAGDIQGLCFTTSSAGGVFANACYWGSDGTNPLITTAGTGTSEIYNSYLSVSAAAAVTAGSGTTINLGNCEINSSASNAITGAGTVNYGGLVFTNSANTITASTTVGYVNRPGITRSSQQPAFQAYLGSTASNVTGDGTAYSVVYDTKAYDQNTNFNTGTGVFVAPYAGVYNFNCTLYLSGVTVLDTTLNLKFRNVTASADYYTVIDNLGASIVGGVYMTSCSQHIQCASGDNVIVNVLVNGSTKTVSLLGGAGINTFSGYLVC